MDELSILQRKKKTVSNPFDGSLTRSRFEIYVHRSRSGRRRSDPFPPFQPKPEEAAAATTLSVSVSEAELNCDNNAAASTGMSSSIKDLRARRISTPPAPPDFESILNGEKELPTRNPSSDAPDSAESDLRDFKDSRLDETVLENGSNSKDQLISENGSISQSKTTVSVSGKRRKVFRAPSSFSYRRLLPYLTDIAQDDSSASQLAIIDAGIPSKLRKLGTNYSEERSLRENSYAEVNMSGNEVTQTELPCNHTNSSSVEDELDQTPESLGSLEGEQKSNGNSLSGVEYLSKEECGQMTPPDSDILAKMEVGHSTESMDAKNVPVDSQIFKDWSACSEKSMHNLPETKLTNGSVFKPCSRLRVFKNQRSLSYKRLLPILMDISKYNSGASTLSQCPKPVVHFTEDSQPPTPFSAEEENNVKEMGTQKSQEKENDKDQGKDLLPPVLLPADGASSNDVDFGQSTTSEEPGPIGRNELSNVAEVNNVSAEKVENVNANQSSFHIEVTDAFVTPHSGPSKGILKRNPRGCRGPCDCLNCAAFRLHAIRAFEFSRNQMLDAEEVVSDLMRELAYLRVMLQKYIFHGDGLSSIQLNPVQVNQACNKALEAENLAKARLNQLNSDLNVHCRIPTLLQPKVTFANHIQERAIPVLDPSIASAEKKS